MIGYPILALLLYIIEWGGQYFYFYVWVFLAIVMLLMMTIYPAFIAPLFNKFSPLEDGSLKSKIEALAARLNFPLTKLFVIDGSKRSAHSNAYMYGFFKNKRIVLYDTLINQQEEEEVVAVLAHELGHWKMWHTIQGMIVSQTYMFFAFYFFGQCQHDHNLFASFGFSKIETPVFIGLLLFFQVIWAPVDKVLSFILTLNSRRNEFQADYFGAELGYAKQLQSALAKLHMANLGNMNPDPYYSAYHYSHPPLVERLEALQNADIQVAKKKK